MSKLPLGLTALAVLGAVALWVLNCTGPVPTVVETRLREPGRPSEPYLVEAVVQNTWRGHGEVNVAVRLHDATGRQTYSAEETVPLEPYETVRVVVPVYAPPGGYTPEVQVEYPPR